MFETDKIYTDFTFISKIEKYFYSHSIYIYFGILLFINVKLLK